jgi:DNA gyrase subunit A
MAQEWSMRYRLVDGQGNFDLLTATALQQCVIQRPECECIRRNTGYKKETVDFQLNFDDTLYVCAAQHVFPRY